MIPYGRQDICEEDIAAVVTVLRSDFITQGPVVPAFENAVAHRVGAARGVATNSATSALHLACLALGVGPNDYVWTSAITFAATANCARYCGANVDFVDIDPNTFNMSAAALESKLKDAKQRHRLPKVVIPVHLCGEPADLAEIHALATEYGFRVIEDASHAVGATYRGRPIGDCTYSDIVIMSFHPVKIITTAEGGMALTNDESLARKMELLRSHGITREWKEMEGNPDGAWYYEQVTLGFNYRITDLQAALGISQLRRLDEFVSARHRLASEYQTRLQGLPLILPTQSTDRRSALHLYVVRVRPTQPHRSRRELFDALRQSGIGVNVHYVPVYWHPYYSKMGFARGYCPKAEAYYRSALSLPMYPSLTEQAMSTIIETLHRVLE